MIMENNDRHIVAIDLGSSKISVTVAKVNGEYKVLFDDYLIEIMLDSITEETE